MWRLAALILLPSCSIVIERPLPGEQPSTTPQADVGAVFDAGPTQGSTDGGNEPVGQPDAAPRDGVRPDPDAAPALDPDAAPEPEPEPGLTEGQPCGATPECAEGLWCNSGTCVLWPIGDYCHHTCEFNERTYCGVLGPNNENPYYCDEALGCCVDARMYPP